MSKRLTWLVVALALAALSGCGSGGAVTGGGLRVEVAWPTADSRFIPSTALAVVIELYHGPTLLDRGRAVLVRPQTTVQLDRLETGPAILSAYATPQADGTGVPVSAARMNVDIVAGDNTPVQLALASTITAVQVAPQQPQQNSPPQVIEGDSLPLTVSARDSLGRAVLVPPGNWEWSSDTVNAAVDSTGNVIGMITGKAAITARDKESRKSGSLSIAVKPKVPLVNVIVQ